MGAACQQPGAQISHCPTLFHACNEQSSSVERTTLVFGSSFYVRKCSFHQQKVVSHRHKFPNPVQLRSNPHGPGIICREKAEKNSSRNIVCAARKRFAAPELGERDLDTEADVIIIGAGIIGLSIAQTLLRDTLFSVAIVDRAQPCAGATGAGQGYIWLGNRQPGTPPFEFAKWSKSLWENFADQLALEPCQRPPPLGWVRNGSLLVAANGREAEGLEKQVELLQGGGVGAELWDAERTRADEPALSIDDDGGAAFLTDDAQLDAELAVAALREQCQGHVATGRYTELFYEPVESFLWSSDGSTVEGVRTSKRVVRARRSVVLATGAWTTDVLAATSQGGNNLGTALAAIRPRKGHLLVVEGPGLPQLKHALMECEYSANAARAAPPLHPPPHETNVLPQSETWAHPSSTSRNNPEMASETASEPYRPTQTASNDDVRSGAPGGGREVSVTSAVAAVIPPGPYKPSVPWDPPSSAETLTSLPSVSVSMTATSDAFGRLLIGSSREFSGFDAGIRDETILAIIRRAAQFLPVLENLVLERGVQRSVRTGLRPYATNGRPSIGAVPGVEGLLVAAGHEGSGLCLAPGTAAVIRDLLLGATPEIDCSYFAPEAARPLGNFIRK